MLLLRSQCLGPSLVCPHPDTKRPGMTSTLICETNHWRDAELTEMPRTEAECSTLTGASTLPVPETSTTTKAQGTLKKRRGGWKSQRMGECWEMLPSGQDVAVVVMKSQQLLLPMQDLLKAKAARESYSVEFRLANGTACWGAMTMAGEGRIILY